MNIVDVGILIIMFLSAVMGVMRGMTREVLGLISWTAAGFSAFFTLPLTQSLARSYIQNPMLADIVSGALLFIIFLVLFSFISQFFSGLVRQSGLGGIDRSLGFGYGLLRGFALICLVEIMMGVFVSRPEYPALFRDSHLGTTIYKGSDILFPFLPSSIQQLIKQQQQKHIAPSSSSKSQPTSSNQQDLITNAIKTQIQQGAQAIIPSTMSNQSPPPSLSKNPGGDTYSTTQSAYVDNQKTVEELAMLKPKAADTKTTATTYTKQQKLDMARLVEQDDAVNGE